MRRRTKIGLTVATLGAGLVLLTGCTASFCSTNDVANILSVYDNGVCKFYDYNDASIHIDEDPESDLKEGYYQITTIEGVSPSIVFDYKLIYNNGGITRSNESAVNNKVEYIVDNAEFWACFDLAFIEKAVNTTGKAINTASELEQLYVDYGYIRYSSNQERNWLWDNWDLLKNQAIENYKSYSSVSLYGMTYDISKIPTSDYTKIYKATLDGVANGYKGCITVQEGAKFGMHGWNGENVQVPIESKSYGYAWSKGFLEGLLVYPIGALIDTTCNAFQGVGTGLNGTNGWAQILTILIVTIIVRLFLFFVSFKSTLSNARMTNLQPQVAKIQAKYPNANTNKAEKARMADEMSKLYRKNKINPMSSLLVMIVQFPVFICVWSAFIGSSWLSTGSFFGLGLSQTISGTLFNGANWANGSAVTAFILFIIMAISQVASMVIPQILQKRSQNKAAKLGKNPTMAKQNKTMKIVMFVMMAMVIVMGFSLASAMCIYWFIGALVSIAQTFVTQAIVDHQAKEKKN